MTIPDYGAHSSSAKTSRNVDPIVAVFGRCLRPPHEFRACFIMRNGHPFPVTPRRLIMGWPTTLTVGLIKARLCHSATVAVISSVSIGGP